MKKVSQNSRKWVMFLALFVAFFHYSYETRADQLAALCEGQVVKVVRTTFLWWSWYHVEDGYGNTIEDKCNSIDGAKERWGVQ
jgi:succinate dehydrogenase hydrophobic anchor subunit